MGLGHVVLALHIAAGAGGLAVPAPACVIEPPAERVVDVRFFSESRLGVRSFATIIQTANKIWAPYGILIREGASRAAINVVVAADASATADANNESAVIGTTMFSDGHATSNIHLSLGAAERLADRVGGEERPLSARPLAALDALVLRVLGVALAHELAHYLLDTPDHASEGLLRARFSLVEMANAQPARLSLTCAQRQALFRAR